MIHILIYLIAFFGLIYYLLTRNYDYFKIKGIPYDEPFLFFGSFFNVAAGKQHILYRICDIYNKHKQHPYVGSFIFNKPTLMINSPELLKKVLVKDFDKFADRNVAANEKIDPISFHTLFSSKGKTWKGLRNKISPVFTSGKMKLMMPLMQDCGNTFVEVLNNKSGQEVSIRDYTKKYAIDVISSCAFGINSYCLKNDDAQFLKLSTQLLDTNSIKRNFSLISFFFIPSFVTLFRLTFVDKDASDNLMKIFKNTLIEREKNKIVRNDLIDLLNNLKKNEESGDEYTFDDQKMASQAISFFGAGNETTSTTISYTLYELALDKKFQDKLRTEIRESFNTNNGFTYEGIQNMKYLGMVVNETLRKYPLTSFLNREVVEDYVMEDGIKIDKGTSVMVPVCGLHFDPEYFPNPNKYDPERFNDENKSKIVPYTFLPFGEGPRNCIGQRFGLLATKIALCYLIKDFEFDVSENTPIPIVYDPRAIFLTNRGSLYIKATKIRL